MSRLVRTLLMWLLVLAVPVQGTAAATMAFCGSNHHGAGQAAHLEQPTAAVHVHEHHDDADGDHHHAQAAHDEDATATAQAAPHAKLVHADKHKCSACASCCTVAALPSAIKAFQPDLLADSFLPLVPRGVTLLLPGGLERPPRFVLA